MSAGLDFQFGRTLKVTGIDSVFECFCLRRRLALKVKAGGCSADNHQLIGHIRMFQGKLQQHTPAIRAAYQVRPVNAQVTHQVMQILHMRKIPGWHFTFAVAAPVIAQDTVAAGKFIRLGIPHAAVSYPGMNQNHRVTAAGDFVIQICPVNRRETR
jgi:hypothetical protein